VKIDLTVLVALLVGLGAVVTYAANALRGIRKWVRKTAASTERAEEKLTTESGVPIAVQIERTAVSLDRRLESQAATVRETHEVALGARAIATDVRDRLDRHLIYDHGAQPAPAQE
jgi:predicted nuclease with RNAse H fold